MYVFRLLGIGLFAGSFALLPSVSESASYQRYSSKTCPYSIDFPTQWLAHSNRAAKADSFGHRFSATRGVGVVVACGPTTARETVQHLTSSEMQSFHKQGYVLGAPHLSGEVGIFTGQKTIKTPSGPFKAIVEVSSFIHNTRKWIIYLLADRSTFKQSLPIYVHMLASFRGK
ncbi:MAG: hypothetical protein NVSMB52_21300 [Chloroflexota bacterium]